MTNGSAERELLALLSRSEQLGDQLRAMANELTGFVDQLAAQVAAEEAGGGPQHA